MKNFWSKVDKTKTCWLWTAYKDRDGYGQFYFNEQQMRAHRVAWILTHKKIPNKNILHHCDNPACVRPSHLFEGSIKDNAQDCLRKGRWNAAKGETHYRSTLSDAKINIIRSPRMRGLTQTQIGILMGCSQSNIHYILSKKTRN